MLKLNLMAGWFPPADLPENVAERYMEQLVSPEATRPRPKVEVRALVHFDEGGRTKVGFFHGVDRDGMVIVRCPIPSHEGCKRQKPDTGRLVVRSKDEVGIVPL